MDLKAIIRKCHSKSNTVDANSVTRLLNSNRLTINRCLRYQSTQAKVAELNEKVTSSE